MLRVLGRNLVRRRGVWRRGMAESLENRVTTRIARAAGVEGLDSGGERMDGSVGKDGVMLYWSPESKLIRFTSWLFMTKACGAIGLSAWWTWREVEKLQALLAAWESAGTDFASFVDASNMELPVFSIGAGLGLLGYLGLWQVRKGTTRVVRRLTLVGEEVRIESMGALWGVREMVKRREDVECATPNKLTPHFVTVPEGGWWLFPVKGWQSEDLGRLKAFLWYRYFRDDPPPIPERDLIAIEGFGSYRPAALADPNHPASRAIPFPAQQKDVKGTSYTVHEDGNVYAEFDQGSDFQSLEQRRKQALIQATSSTNYPPTASSRARSGTVTRTVSEDGKKHITDIEIGPPSEKL